ncbi:MAG TPA: cysteine desulfurase family protein [Candidatus Dormibacteraeota bacterium]|nr:cysteine desulfurase family protein [Candidatus Dormibacteraeota bacterium]
MTLDPAVYLDHAATTPIAREVCEVMLPLLAAGFGNPSSIHARGRVARNAVDEARDRVAAAVGCAAREVVFTSGGSEADNLALRGAVDRRGGGHIVVSAIEHDAVIKCAEDLAALGRATVSVVGCDPRGVVDPEEVAAAVGDETVVVSVMLANNEVGTIQDVSTISDLVHRRNPRTLVHTDAVQALGKLRLDLDELGVDLLSVTAHKVYGPKGAGALIVRGGVALTTQISGGGQERARRSGTENVAGIAGFGAAAALVEAERESESARLSALSGRLVELVVTELPDTVVTGAGAPRLPSFATFAFPGVESEVLMTLLDRLGLEASGGSACSSGAHMPSHVLAAMGLPPAAAGGALRLTLGRDTTSEQVDAAAATVVAAVRQVRAAIPAAI